MKQQQEGNLRRLLWTVRQIARPRYSILIIVLSALLSGCQAPMYTVHLRKNDDMNSSSNNAVSIHLVAVDKSTYDELKKIGAKKWFDKGLAKTYGLRVQRLSLRKGTGVTEWEVKSSTATDDTIGYFLFVNYGKTMDDVDFPCRKLFAHNKRFVLAPVFGAKRLQWSIDLKAKSISSNDAVQSLIQ